jgi:hypothetical protein
MPRKPILKRVRGYDYGGQVLSTDSLGRSISGGFKTGMDLATAYKDASKPEKKPEDKPGDKAQNTSSPKLPSASNDYVRGVPGGLPGVPGDLAGGNARGGKIKRVAGKPIGKDDGLIPAQKGEYVVRKSAVKKLGTAALNQINKGKLPQKRGR